MMAVLQQKCNTTLMVENNRKKCSLFSSHFQHPQLPSFSCSFLHVRDERSDQQAVEGIQGPLSHSEPFPALRLDCVVSYVEMSD